jgi:hypothetical protein
MLRGQIAGYVIAGIRSNVRLRKTSINCIPLSNEASSTSYMKLSASVASWWFCNCAILSLHVWVCSVARRCYSQCIECSEMNIPARSMYTVFVMEMGRQLQQNSSTDGQVRMFTEFWRRRVSANMACSRQYFGCSAEKPRCRCMLTWHGILCCASTGVQGFAHRLLLSVTTKKLWNLVPSEYVSLLQFGNIHSHSCKLPGPFHECSWI